MRLLTLLIFITGNLFAQKAPVDTSSYGKWSSVDKPAITNDGNYISYVINNQPKNEDTYVFQAVNTSWKYECQQLTSSKFSDDSKRVFLLIKDTLCILTLGSSAMEKIPGVKTHLLFMRGKKEWVIINKNSGGKLIMYPLGESPKMAFDGVTGYSVSPDGRTLLLQCTDSSTAKNNFIDWVTISTGARKTIWKGEKAFRYIFDRSGKKLAFYTQTGAGKNVEYAIGYFEMGDTAARKLIDKNTPAMGDKLKITLGMNNNWSFSNDGEYLFFPVTENQARATKSSTGVNVWSYTDAKLQSLQKGSLGMTPSYYSSISIKTGKFLRLVNEYENILTRFYPGWNDEYIVVEYIKGDRNEWNWNPAAAQSTFVVSTKTGERKVIKSKTNKYLFDFELSPDGNYVIFYDSERRDYFSFNTRTGKEVCISAGTKTVWSAFTASESSSISVGTMGWLENKSSVFVQDRFDLWELDIQGIKKPVKLTNGREKNVIYFHAFDLVRPLYKVGETILLKSLDLNSMDQGFSKLRLKPGEKVNDIKAGPYQYVKRYVYPYYNESSNLYLLRARDKEIYLTIIQSAQASPNYFITTNFSTFKEMSHVYPERSFNWITAELHNFSLKDGLTLKGILYKPENFDPNRRYPIIFYYYTLESFRLNAYLSPKSPGGTINIPYLVSNGYLVFIPDMYYVKAGKTGESALNSVLAAVDYLHTKPWIDTKKMAVYGHSFGGFETNYIITHSNIFAAALSASAVSDMISEYNSTWGVGPAPGLGFSKQGLSEFGYVNMGGTLWNARQAYIENSAVLHADKISTPLLMMHNENDGAVHFSQGLEFFIALRRLNKKIWLLEYDNEDHVIVDNKMAIDYDFRVKQFFDHFLKGMPMPIWMSKGIPANLKGIEDGLELDTEIKTP